MREFRQMIRRHVQAIPANVLVFTLLGSLLYGCSNHSPPDAGTTVENSKERCEFFETQRQSMSKEVQARKRRLIALLQSEMVPVIDHLPVIEDENESKRRTTDYTASCTQLVDRLRRSGMGRCIDRHVITCETVVR